LDQIDQQTGGNGHQHYAILTQKFEALNGRRAVHFLMGNMNAGWEDARALLPLARQMEEDPTWLVDALLQQPGVSAPESRQELLEGVPLAQEALKYASKIGDKRREMNCLLAIASQRNLLNDPTWVEVGDTSLALAREVGDRQYEAMILLGLGHAYVGRDEIQKGMEYLNAALPICKELDDKIAEMMLMHVLGAQYERNGDHFRRLTEFEMRRLDIARSIGDRFEEGDAAMFCGQIQAMNLGDLEGGLALLRESHKLLEAVSGRIFPLLRISQVQISLGHFEDAQKSLETAAPLAESNVYDLSRVGLKMVTVLLYNALGDVTHLNRVLELTQEVIEMENSQLVSRQYPMAAYSEACAAHLGLARLATEEGSRQKHVVKALQLSEKALKIYKCFNYVNIVECAPEEIYLRHSQALAVNGRSEEALEYLENAYDEMMRKYEFIPADSPYRRTYLENIPYHREIRAAHTAATLAKINTPRPRK
jgi:tetratricopeptide (TPR) repeat protein